MKTLPDYWNKIEEISIKYKDETSKTNNYAILMDKLIEEYKVKNYIQKLPFETLQIPDYIIIAFYRNLFLDLDRDVKSPVSNKSNSNWMFDSDFCFFNVRACGLEENSTGNFIDSVKILPTLRMNAIHIAPFFDCAFGNLYAIDSIDTITDSVVNNKYLALGVTREEQLKFFIDCIHLLNMTAGFDLEPHTSQFSRVVLMHPELFRWIKLNKSKQSLEGGLSQSEILKSEKQKQILQEISSIKDGIFKKYGISSLEGANIPINKTRECSSIIISKLIEEGYWTIPNHIWNGIGLPEFDRYNFEHNYPIFKYINWDYQDDSQHAFGMTTPYKFYNNLPINKKPEESTKPTINEDAINFFSNIFINMAKQYNFDFVRYDYVDHVFDSVYGNEKTPLSDRMIPYVVESSINIIRKFKPYIGTIAETFNNDTGLYSSKGFDLLLGANSLMDITSHHLNYIFETNKKIKDYNNNPEAKKGSVLFTIDIHDSAHPLIWQKTPAERKGINGMKLRFFVSRFLLGIGKYKRPKYECIGNQDMTSGLYKANNVGKSIKWENNNEFNDIYHNIENLYIEFQNITTEGNIEEYLINDSWAYWFIDNYNKTQRLLCIIYLEKETIKDDKNKLIEPELSTAQGPRINIIQNSNINKNIKINKILLETKKIIDCEHLLEEKKYLNIKEIHPGEVLCFHIYSKLT